MDLHNLPRLAEALRRDLRARLGRRDDSLRSDKRRDQVRALVEHHRDRFVVEVHAVIDRADPGPDGVLDPFRALGVCHDPPPRGAGLGHQRLQFVDPEVRVAGVVSRGEHSAARRHLDHVGAVTDELADLPAHFLRPVDDRVGRPRIRRTQPPDVLAEGHPLVTVPACLGQHPDGYLQTGSWDQPVLHRLLHAQVGSACISHGGDPRAKRRLEVLRSLVEPIRERGLDPAHEIDVAEHDMRVTVEQPGQKDPVGQIDGFVAVQAGPDRPDPAVLYHHVGGGQRP